MTKDEIIAEVRLCIDDATWNKSGLSMPSDDAITDEIITSKIKYALVWLALNAPIDLMYDESSIFLSDAYSDFKPGDKGVLTLPAGFVRLVRVRMPDWSKAVTTPITEDSDQYLMQDDPISKGTADRPVAAIVGTQPRKLELFPGIGDGVEITSVIVPDFDSKGDGVDIPQRLRPSFVYYIAFLTLAAFRDNDAATMLQIARINIGMEPVQNE